MVSDSEAAVPGSTFNEDNDAPRESAASVGSAALVVTLGVDA